MNASIIRHIHDDRTYVDYNGLLAWLMQERDAKGGNTAKALQQVIDALAWWMVTPDPPK